jgi:hypothetical protein
VVVDLSPAEAYIDREAGEALVGSKVPVAAGTVDGTPWSLVTYLAAPDASGDEPMAPAPCVQVFLGREGEHGGGGACLSPVSPQAGAFEAVGIAWGDVPAFAYAGVAGDRVDSVDLLVSGEEAPRVANLKGASEISGSRVFVIFVPPGISGAMRVRGVDGGVVEMPLCLTGVVNPGASVVGCRVSPA